jgi:hypothetical protein
MSSNTLRLIPGRRWLMLLGVTVALAGCKRHPPQDPHEYTAEPPQATSKPLDVYDGFEKPELSQIWDQNRFADNAVVMERSVVRAGHQAIAVTVRSHDKFEAGRDGNLDTERDELRETHSLTSRENVPYETRFSMFFPPNFPIVDVRLVIAQWKQYCPTETGPCSDQSPVLAIRYVNGEMIITQAIAGKRHVLFQQKVEFRNRWLDFVVRARFTPNANGHEAVWLNGTQIIEYKGVTANAELPAGGYPNPSFYFFKMGLYRDLMPQPMTVYIDEYYKRELKADEF